MDKQYFKLKDLQPLVSERTPPILKKILVQLDLIDGTWHQKAKFLLHALGNDFKVSDGWLNGENATFQIYRSNLAEDYYKDRIAAEGVIAQFLLPYVLGYKPCSLGWEKVKGE